MVKFSVFQLISYSGSSNYKLTTKRLPAQLCAKNKGVVLKTNWTFKKKDVQLKLRECDKNVLPHVSDSQCHISNPETYSTVKTNKQKNWQFDRPKFFFWKSRKRSCLDLVVLLFCSRELFFRIRVIFRPENIWNLLSCHLMARKLARKMAYTRYTIETTN